MVFASGMLENVSFSQQKLKRFICFLGFFTDGENPRLFYRLLSVQL